MADNDTKAILAELAEEKAKKKGHTFWLSPGLVREFTKHCKPFSPSRVIEKMMIRFIEDAKKRR